MNREEVKAQDHVQSLENGNLSYTGFSFDYVRRPQCFLDMLGKYRMNFTGKVKLILPNRSFFLCYVVFREAKFFRIVEYLREIVSSVAR